MAVKITIHRGTDQIGGSITEIATERTHIFIDFGASLSGTDGRDSDEKMVNIINSAVQEGRCDAIFFTHFHGDHIGLLERLPMEYVVDRKAVQLGMGAFAKEGLRIIHKTLAQFDDDEEEKEKHEKILKILNEGKWADFSNVNSKTTAFTFNGDITITPISVDHSAFDSYMFIIEAEGKCIVHTGDFRVHGRLGKGFLGEGFFERLEKLNVDVLITEGTMMKSPSKNPEDKPADKELIEAGTEQKLEDKAKELLKKDENNKNKCAFVVCSSTNVESLASFHNAAKENGLKLYVNSYVYEQMELYNRFAEETGSDKLGIWFDLPKSNDTEDINKAIVQKGIVSDNIKNDGFVMLINNPTNYIPLVKTISQNLNPKPLLIYSMWDGYIGKKGGRYQKEEHMKLWNMFENRFILHTGGHAYPDDIRAMIEKADPQKAIIPIHTENGGELKNLVKDEDKDKVKLLSDGDSYNVNTGKVEKRTEKTRQEIADRAAELLEKNSNWKERYREYIKKIKVKKDYVEAVYDHFDASPLAKYTSVGRVKDVGVYGSGNGVVEIDLRAAGTAIADIVVSPKTKQMIDDIKNGPADKESVLDCAVIKFKKKAVDKVKGFLLESEDKKEYEELTEQFFIKEEPSKGTVWKPREIQWGSEEFKKFLSFLGSHAFALSAEHPMEAKLLNILDDDEGKKAAKLDKLKLCKLAGQFYQLCTPLAASGAKDDLLYYSKDDKDRDRRGGGIDILAYTDTDEKQLCVIELKDTYNENEPPEKAVKQAIAYAAFIIKLLRSDKENEVWYEQFGLELPLPEKLTVNAVIAMPYPENWREKHTGFAGEELKVGKDIIKLHYMYFKTEQNELINFETSLFKE